jgi:serine/threonine-protein kinase
MTIPDRLQAALVDRYRIDRELGQGGMATVYLAQDLKHDRPVALKVLREELQQALGAERFEREIRLAARLQHPHILTVLDSGADGGVLWFTMPYVEGESLRARLQRERQLSLRDAIRITREAAQALQYAHDHGIVHRDIKPDNILLTKDGSTLVADFGIARALEAGAPVLTQTGMSLGTPAYMSPEQASGDREVDARSDTYALGVVLYELLAGEAPFTGPTAQAIIAKRFSQAAPSIRASRPNVPENVDRAIQRALAMVPGDRFPTVAAFSEALEPAAVEPTVSLPATPAARPAAPHRRFAVSSALALGLIIGAGLLFAWRRSSGPQQNAAATAATDAVTRLAVLPFENLGDTSDAYFADGVTDAVRGKLISLPALQVIARGSSLQYRSSTKQPGEIAKELGVRYLLTGTVRWAKNADGTSRVQVSPELVEIGPDGAASSRWQQPFDAPLTDVFKVQGDIAAKVTQAMRVALPGNTAAELVLAPTSSPAAYDAYLRGEAAWNSGANTSPPALRAALARFQEAVKLDSTFAQAWSAVATTSAFLYTNSVPTRQLARQSFAALERAEALDPNAVSTQIARFRYLGLVEQNTTTALAQIEAAAKASPNDAAILAALATAERSAGMWDEALRHYEAAAALDPRSALRISNVAGTNLWLRRTAAGIRAADRALALAPGNAGFVLRRAMLEIQTGNVPAAQRVLAADGPVAVPLAIYAAVVWDMGWILDSAAQQLVLAQDSTAFDDDLSALAMVRMQLYDWRGNRTEARRWAGVAHRELVKQIREAPADPQRPVINGLALAVLGRKEEALASIQRGLDNAAKLPDAYANPYFESVAMRGWILLGEYGKALDMLEPVMTRPFYMSSAWLRVDPMFTPLKGNPRFEKLAGTS